MNLSAPFIKRPIATTLLALGLAIAGVIAFILLPVAALPQIDFPTIAVSASLPGASPEIMATSVATPLERQLGWIAGITEMTSSSTLGSSRITVQFDLSRDINGAARDVQAAINAASSQLPTNLPHTPTYRKVNPADTPIVIISLTSDHYTKGQMYDFASTILAQKLAQVDGVGQVNVGGSSLPAVRVELNPTALNRYGISLESVRHTLAAANSNQPKGQFSNHLLSSEIVTNDQLFKAYQYQPLIIAYRDGRPVRLADVAEVNDATQDLRNAGLADGKPSVLLVVFKQPSANVINTVDRVKKMLPQLKAAIPAGIDMTVAMDRTLTIRASLHDIEKTLVISMLLVILVVLAFLGNLRAMIIPGVAVPLSLLGTFAVMSLCGYSLDNLSLMALTISTGFVVDDAIVVLENITRHLEKGLAPIEAALAGAKEVSFTVLSMSISLIAVFTPIILMGGIVGRLFREFALTLSSAILISLLVSLTVTPMMCALLLRSENRNPAEKTSRKIFTAIHSGYDKSLSWSLAHPGLMLMLTVAAVILNIYLFIIVPKGFFPQQDTGRVSASIQASQNISFQALQQKFSQFADIVQQDPAVEHVVGFVGTSGFGGNTSNSASLFISLKSLEQRNLTSDQVIARLRAKLKVVEGANLYMQTAQDLVIGGRQGNSQYQYTVTADKLEDLKSWTPQISERLNQLVGITDVNSDLLNHGLQSFVTIDHDSAQRFNITSKMIDDTLYNAFGQSLVSVMYTPLNQYYVVMEVAPRYWQHPDILNDIYVLSPSNKEVPLAAITHFASSATLLSVNHQGQSPAATLSFNLQPGYSLGDAVNKVEDMIQNMHLPENLHAAFQGTAQAFQASLASEPYLILFALIAVYIVLGILYESLVHPITILSTLPSAGVGALLALLLTGTDLSIIALIGIILLIGIVKKNAIMMIDFALQAERHENKTPREAIHEAALLRFRPIMMTTLSALLGALPLALGMGVGSELRKPLGIAIIGGLIISQMLTLYTTPVVYLAFERARIGCQQYWKKILGNKINPIEEG